MSTGMHGTIKIARGEDEGWFVYKGARAPPSVPVVRVRISPDVDFVAAEAFSDRAELRVLDLSNAVEVGEGAFRDCISLRRVVLSPSLRTVGPGAFAGCTSLRGVDFSSVAYIGRDAFRWCDSLKRVVIPPTVIDIGAHAFCYCAGLKEVSFGRKKRRGLQSLLARGKSHLGESRGAETLTLGEGAFMYCKALGRVAIPPACAVVAKDAFHGCTKLKNVHLSNVSVIGAGAFQDCAMKRIKIPASAEAIGAYAFSGCEALEAVDLPRAKKIGDGAFRTCYSLARVSMPLVCSIDDGAFEWCLSLKNICIPPAVEVVSARAFEWCVKLEGVELCKGLKVIGNGAFRKCRSLKCISVPSSVTHICSEAFTSCDKLSEVKLAEGGIQTINYRAFSSPFYPIIRVPCPAYVDGPQTQYCDDKIVWTGIIHVTGSGDWMLRDTIIVSSKCLETMDTSEKISTMNKISTIFNMRNLTKEQKFTMIREMIYHQELTTIVVPILELAIWKAKLVSQTAESYADRQACRRDCGADMNIIIRGVLQFFRMIYRDIFEVRIS